MARAVSTEGEPDQYFAVFSHELSFFLFPSPPTNSIISAISHFV